MAIIYAPTYRVAFNFQAVASALAWELAGANNRTIRVKRIRIVAGTAANLQIHKYSAPSTGGTVANVSPVPLDSAFVASLALLKTFTGAPTPGTDLGQIEALNLAANAPQDFTIGDAISSPLTLRSGSETLGVYNATGGAVTLSGFVEFTEETS